jgi:hypothetical protein
MLLDDGFVRVYNFPAGIFEIHEQLLIPENTTVIGAASPNDMSNPSKRPDYSLQTLFLSTKGYSDYNMDYCNAQDMVTTRVGFVLSSHNTVKDICFQGADTIRPNDNQALCGGAAFETKGCASNNCFNSYINNGGSDGLAVEDVVIDNVRLNDYYWEEDQHLVGKNILGNTECRDYSGCCFCKPNGIRSSQVGVYIPQSRDVYDGAWTQDVSITNIVSRATQADGINLHGNLRNVRVHNTYFENTGDDGYALWGANNNPENVTFSDAVIVNPGVLRPNWYGNCGATYGLKQVLFKNLTCRAPTLKYPIPVPNTWNVTHIDNSMFVFFSSFSADYPWDNNLTIDGWTFEDLKGKPYYASKGTLNQPKPHKMVWTKTDDGKGGIIAPYWIPDANSNINVYAVSP